MLCFACDVRHGVPRQGTEYNPRGPALCAACDAEVARMVRDALDGETVPADLYDREVDRAAIDLRASLRAIAAAEDARDEDDSHTAHLTPFHAGTP